MSVAVVSGLALGTAFEPFDWPYVMPLALAGWMVSMRGRTGRFACAAGLLFGAAFMLLTLSWMRASIGLWAWLGLALVQSLWFCPLGWAMARVRRLPGWPIWAASLWTTVELLRGSWPFGGLPWGRLGFAVIDTPWSALLPHLGVTGTGFLVAIVGFGLAALVSGSHPSRGTSLRHLALLSTIAISGAAPTVLAEPVDPSGFLTVAVVQGNVPGDGTRVVQHHRQVTTSLAAATKQLARQVQVGALPMPDLIVWPENSTAVDPFNDARAHAAIVAAVAAVDRPVLVGAMVDAPDPGRVLNQGIVWDPTTGPSERYTKRHPVPFGEYIPFRALLTNVSDRLASIPRDMQPGTRQTPLRAAGTQIAVAICFDVAYDEVITQQVRNGGQVAVVQTSNAMFIRTPQVAQQFAISRVRAIETHRSVAIAATNGISAIIAPGGQIIARAQTRTRQTLVARIPLSNDLTWAVRSGPLIGYLIASLAFGALLAALRRGRSRAHDQQPTS